MESNVEKDKHVVFIVEDSDVYRSLLVHALEQAGDEEHAYQVIDFPSGEKCLQYLHLKPDIIILDHFLNGNGYLYNMDGLGILHRIRRFSPGTDVVVVSCQENIEVAKTFMGSGVKDYIRKDDAGPVRVRSAVKQLLRRRRQAQSRSRMIKYAAAAMITSALSGLVYWLT
jgi:DNA-binding NarL/FixJ family response regulator